MISDFVSQWTDARQKLFIPCFKSWQMANIEKKFANEKKMSTFLHKYSTFWIILFGFLILSIHTTGKAGKRTWEMLAKTIVVKQYYLEILFPSKIFLKRRKCIVKQKVEYFMYIRCTNQPSLHQDLQYFHNSVSLRGESWRDDKILDFCVSV
jgi:hypothetical protein